MSASKVGTRYASALLDEARAQKVLEAVYADMKLLDRTVSANRDLYLMLLSPIVTGTAKKNVLHDIFGKAVQPLTSSFLELLVQKRREAYLPEIVKAFYEEYNLLMNIKEIGIVSASELSRELEERIVAVVQKQLGDVQLHINKSVDPGLLGGMVVKVDDKVFDTSVLHKLQALKREIVAS